MRDSNAFVTAVQGDGKGFPDLTMVRGERLAFAELKAENGRVSPDQRTWLESLSLVAEVYVWKPSHWNEIEEVLA